MSHDVTWWTAPRNEVHKHTIQFVNHAEDELGDVFERLFRLEYLYDPNNPDADRRQQDRVTENAIASNIDTVSAVIANADMRARYMTDGGDWKQQRTARRLEWYSEDLSTRYEVLPKCRKAFKEASKKGNGFVKVHAVFDEPRVEHVLLENIVVPPEECRDGRDPRQIHQWDYIDADELELRFPGAADDIHKARAIGRRRRNSYSRTIMSNDVECLWSYRLPIGAKDKGKKNYKPGRVTLVIEGRTLLDEPWEKDHFPFAMIIWSDRINSFYKISAAERIMGIQRALNRRNWTIEKGNDNAAHPTVYHRPADANVAIKTNRAGNFVSVRGDYPVTVTHAAVNAETYKSRIDLLEAAQREFGQTTMATHGAKPAGLDSGVAMREFKDQTTQRFASQELEFERLILRSIYLLIEVCKDLGAKAPKVTRKSRFGPEVMEWKDVDLCDARVQMKAAANLNRTPAGRYQLVIEFAQAGIISTDQARKLFQHPDLERELSLYTAIIEVVELDLDAIADGHIVMPDPLTNLEICQWRAQREYAQWLRDGASEEILEALRQYIVQAVYMGNMANAPAQGMPVDGAQPMAAAPPMPGDVAAMPDPMAAQPSAAFSPQAMDILPS
jgi:hypothetical protein